MAMAGFVRRNILWWVNSDNKSLHKVHGHVMALFTIVLHFTNKKPKTGCWLMCDVITCIKKILVLL